LGKALPNKIYQRGQNRRYADFGTVVESCSKKLPLSSAALVCGYTGLFHQYSDCSGVFCPLFTTTTVKRVRFGKCSGNFFVFPVCSLQQSGGVVCQRFLKMGAKKAANLFQDLLLICRCDGRRYCGIKLSAVKAELQQTFYQSSDDMLLHIRVDLSVHFRTRADISGIMG
jgi:hypothetical protein